MIHDLFPLKVESEVRPGGRIHPSTFVNGLAWALRTTGLTPLGKRVSGSPPTKYLVEWRAYVMSIRTYVASVNQSIHPSTSRLTSAAKSESACISYKGNLTDPKAHCHRMSLPGIVFFWVTILA